MDTAQWPQERVVKPMEEIIVPNNTTSRSNSKANSNSLERKIRPQKVQALNCPRCNSTNTKFCYYNNYNLSQPRYFCKTCRRYWTEGGSLRNIPVGGGSRKNKRSSSSSNSSKKLPSVVLPQPSSTENPEIHDGQDLNLGFPTHDFKTISHFIQVPNFENSDKKSHLSALELLTGVSSRGCGNSNSFFMPITISDPCTIYSSGFSLPTLEFSLDGIGNSGYGSLQESGNSGRASFPFEDLKQVSSTSDHMEQNREQGDSTGYWSGALGGGSW